MTIDVSLGSLNLLGNASPSMRNGKEDNTLATLHSTVGATDSANIDLKELDKAVSHIKEFAQEAQHNLHFELDEESGQVVVNVVDQDTGKLIRQLPSEEALKLARNLKDLNSFLFSEKA
ncbi:flagellar protein FlaG [Pseudomonas luteola]|uniref:flagellar protein FlaG n=1 Tax=Pseudomonas luteola TaxID=47886 RepID=UPI003A856E44